MNDDVSKRIAMLQGLTKEGHAVHLEAVCPTLLSTRVWEYFKRLTILNYFSRQLEFGLVTRKYV